MKVSVLLLIAILCVRNSFAQIIFVNDDFVSTSITSSSWNQPVGLLFSKNGDKLFVWEKAGKVYVCNRNSAGEYQRQASPVIDISEEVGDYSDYGLTGFALDPDFESNGKIYLSYVVDRYYLLTYGKPGYNTTPTKIDKPGATIGRITSYNTSANAGVLSATPGSRIVLVGETKETGVPILHKSHGTGSLVFAADGTLLASMGDGASFDDSDEGSSPFTYYQDALADGIIRADENVGAWRSQKLTSLNGKLLRLDPLTGNGIISNPFYEAASPGSTKSRIWALGLRNPFRISIQPGQGSINPASGHIGEVFVGEVGFGRWEELNVIKEKGMNFGWPLFEGNDISYAYDGLGKIGNSELSIPPDIDCGRPYVRFHEQLRQDNAAKDARLYYPCSSTLMGDDLRYIHARPVLEWLHAAENEGANARVGIFSSSGDADVASIGTPASNVAGTVFNGNASTGGIWYTGTGGNFPAEYANSFFMSDYGGRWIKRVTFDNNYKVAKVEDFASNTTVVCMAENPTDGSLFYVDYGSGTMGTASINKITFGGNKPPVVKVKADKYFAPASNLTVQFDGRDSYDPDQGGSIASYAWDFDDGTTSTDSKPAHTFINPLGTPKKFDVKLTVTDIEGASAEQDFVVSLNNTPPVASIISPIKGSRYKVGGDSTLALEAIINDAENNISQYEWQTILVHNEHTHAESTDSEPQTSAVVSLIGCQGDNYHWLIRLKVTDNAGLSKIDTSEIYPDCTQPLPIFLHKFSVTQNGSLNLVKWTTELESSIEYFELERSGNGINFVPINKQEAQNTAGPNHYSFDDNSLPGLTYYRLKIVEHGNIIRYSVIIRTTTGGEKSELKVVPNPVVDNFSLTYLSPGRDRVTIQIRDMGGKIVHSMNEEVHKGQNVIYMQNLPTWLSGVYFISLQNKNEIKQAKFVKTN